MALKPTIPERQGWNQPQHTYGAMMKTLEIPLGVLKPEQVLPAFGLLNLPPGSYLVIKGWRFRCKEEQEDVRRQLHENMPKGVKVLFIPDGVELSVLTVPDQVEFVA